MSMQAKLENMNLLTEHPDWPVYVFVSNDFADAFDAVGDIAVWLVDGLEHFWADGRHFDDPDNPPGFNPEEVEWTQCLIVEVEDVL